MNTYKNTVKIICGLMLLISSSLLTATEGGSQAAQDLINIIHVEKTIDESIDAVLLMLRQASPDTDKHENEIKNFLQKYMKPENMRKEVIKLYDDLFTEEELREIIAFYQTKTGQKTLEQMPEIMKRSMQISQDLMMKHINELEEIFVAGQQVRQKAKVKDRKSH